MEVKVGPKGIFSLV